MRAVIFAILCAPLLVSAETKSFNAPVKKFRLPTFNDQGYRTSLLVGDEANIVSTSRIDISEMHFTLFSGDETNAIDTTLLAPVATVRIQEHSRTTVEGSGVVRVIRDDLDASGEDWSFVYPDKKLLMKKNVHVLFRAELKDLLK